MEKKNKQATVLHQLTRKRKWVGDTPRKSDDTTPKQLQQWTARMQTLQRKGQPKQRTPGKDTRKEMRRGGKKVSK